MKIIAFEEHYKTPAIHEANKTNPIEKIYDRWKKLGRFAGDPSGTVPPGIYDLDERRIAVMDKAGIDVQILSHTVPGPEELEPSLAIELARQANDAAHEAVSKYPERFKAFATLPMRDPKAAVEELERTVHKLGFVGALINGHVNGRYLDDKFFWPVFECAEHLNLPVYLHPNRPPQSVVSVYYDGFNPVVSGFLALAGVGWHVDTGLHALRLILAGLFDSFPRLQMIVGHHLEILSWTAWRAAYGFAPKDTGLKRNIMDYLRENFYGGILAGEFADQTPGEIDPTYAFSFNAYEAMVNLVGTDRVLFTSDYPYGSIVASRRFFDQMPINPGDKEKIAHLNAKRLLGLALREKGWSCGTTQKFSMRSRHSSFPRYQRLNMLGPQLESLSNFPGGAMPRVVLSLLGQILRVHGWTRGARRPPGTDGCPKARNSAYRCEGAAVQTDLLLLDEATAALDEPSELHLH